MRNFSIEYLRVCLIFILSRVKYINVAPLSKHVLCDGTEGSCIEGESMSSSSLHAASHFVQRVVFIIWVFNSETLMDISQLIKATKREHELASRCESFFQTSVFLIRVFKGFSSIIHRYRTHKMHVTSVQRLMDCNPRSTVSCAPLHGTSSALSSSFVYILSFGQV